MASSDVAYAAIVLAIYLALLLPAAYTTFKHGLQGLAWIGWAYFIIFCTLRIIGSAVQLSDPHSTGAAIISSVGLSPLTIAAGGILHEARFYLLGLRNKTTASRIEQQLVVIFHLVVIGAVALLAVGAAGLSSTKDQADPAKLDNDWHLAAGGALVLLLTIVILFGAAVFTYLSKKPRDAQQHLAQRLVVAVVLACPLLFIRIAGSTAYFFSKNTDMSPISGTWGFRIGLYLVPEVLAALTLLAGGLVARNVKEDSRTAVESNEHKMESRMRKV